jgi:hypothetical protein
MYDVEGLEKDWKRYKNKQRIPWVIALFVLALVAVYVLFRADFSAMLSGQCDKSVNTTKIKEKEIPKPKKQATLQPYVPTLLPKEERGSQLHKEDRDQNRSREDNRPLISIKVSDPTEVPPKKRRKKYIKIELTDMYPDSKKKSRASSTKRAKLSIESVEKNFSRSRSYRDSLYLAQAYYKKGNYFNAQKWALVTNDLNSKLEESWLIFAKSKAKMGQRREAEQVLVSYIKKTNSTKAKVLLAKIKKGKI